MGILPGSVGITVSLWDYMSNVKKLDANWFIWELQKKTTKHWVFDTVHVRFQLIKIVVIINNYNGLYGIVSNDLTSISLNIDGFIH